MRQVGSPPASRQLPGATEEKDFSRGFLLGVSSDPAHVAFHVRPSSARPAWASDAHEITCPCAEKRLA
jgi:hypothetical protein